MPRPQRSRRGNDDGTALPDDALAGIFARLPHAADVVRCAATCARWRRVVATSTAAIPRSPPPFGRFLPQLAVGVCFHLQKPWQQPRFLATASRRRGLLGGGCQRSACPIVSFFDGAAAGLDGGAAAFDYPESRPVASRNGRLVLELRRRETPAADSSLTLCVCNPMTGDAAVLPPLSGDDKPAAGVYGCALLTGDDLHHDHPRRGGAKFFFRLVLVYKTDWGRAGFTELRRYCSDTGRWGPKTKSPVSASVLDLRHISPAVVLRGVAFWALGHGALGVRLDADDPEEHDMDVQWLPLGPHRDTLHPRLLGVSPDNRLLFVYFVMMSETRDGDGTLVAILSYLDTTNGSTREEESTHQSTSSDEEEKKIRMHNIKIPQEDLDTLKLRWVGEKSGVVLFTLGGSRRHNGAHALSLHEGTVEKLADDGDLWGNAVGFEMDWAAYLSSLAHHDESR